MICNLFLQVSRSSDSYLYYPQVTFSCPKGMNQNPKEKKRFMLFPRHYTQTSVNPLFFQSFAPIMWNLLPCCLGPSGHCNKTPQTRLLINNSNLSLTLLEAEVQDQHARMAGFCWRLSSGWWKGLGISMGLFCKTLISFTWEGFILMTWLPLKAPPPNTSPWGSGLNIRIGGKLKHSNYSTCLKSDNHRYCF